MDVRVPSDDDALAFLAANGWLPVVLADHKGLTEAYSNLQQCAAQYFALADDAIEKTRYQARKGSQASEEGFSRIVDEKQILTIRTADRCPELLREEVREAWSLTGQWLRSVSKAIASSLHLNENVLDALVAPCVELSDQKRTPSLLRMFRYDRPLGAQPKVNAEAHKDLGLLSLVVGHSPGLYVRDTASDAYVPVEQEPYISPGSKERSGGMTATLLCGETLAFLTRNQYVAGSHGVVCDPISRSPTSDPYRYSLVFALRPAEVPIYTEHFESDIIGRFPSDQQSHGENARSLFTRIRQAHYNVNIDPEIRRKQKAERQQQSRPRSTAE